MFHLHKKNIFIVGIKGVAMANLALMLTKMGKRVSGWDMKDQFITEELLKVHNISYITDPSIPFPEYTDLVIYSAAHGGVKNPYVCAARKKDISLMHQIEVIAEIEKSYSTRIAVCGTHGKTTTSSLLSYMLIKLNVSPSYIVGVPRFDQYWGADLVHGTYFVVEADEYGISPPDDMRAKFYTLSPSHIIATNIDFDHPDVYLTIKEVQQAFIDFFNKSSVGTVIVCIDDPILSQTLTHIHTTHKIITYGTSRQAHFVVSQIKTDEKHTRFHASYQGKDLGEFAISLFGKHSVLNASGVILFLIEEGYDLGQIKSYIQGFTGPIRRLEQIAYRNDTYLFDDYAHHPVEIRATIEALRSRFPHRRLVVIFQPHTFSRSRILLDEFVTSLSQAHHAFVVDIYASAREKETDVIDSSSFEHKAKNKGIHSVEYVPSSQLLKRLSDFVQPRDILVTMGAGDIYMYCSDIIKLL